MGRNRGPTKQSSPKAGSGSASGSGSGSSLLAAHLIQDGRWAINREHRELQAHGPHTNIRRPVRPQSPMVFRPSPAQPSAGRIFPSPLPLQVPRYSTWVPGRPVIFLLIDTLVPFLAAYNLDRGGREESMGEREDAAAALFPLPALARMSTQEPRIASRCLSDSAGRLLLLDGPNWQDSPWRWY